MEKNFDSDSYKIPAFMRNKAIVRQSRQKLILTALDRKEAGLSHRSKKALAPIKSAQHHTALTSSRPQSAATRNTQSAFSRLKQTAKRFNRVEDLSPTPRNLRQYENLTLEDALSANPQFNQDSQAIDSSKQLKEKIYSIGKITHYLEKIGVAIIMLSGNLKQDDTLLIESENFIFQQAVSEIQIDRMPVTKAPKGSHIGIKVNYPAKIGGQIYKLFSSSSTS